MNSENSPVRRPRKSAPTGSGTSRIDIVTQRPGGPRRTSAASCVEPVLVDGIRASAAREGASISAFVREAVEERVRASHEAAGLPWPPPAEPASEEPALAAGEA